MNLTKEERMQREVRRRVFEHYHRLEEKRGSLEATGHTLNALEEVTGLPRMTLETIALKVRHSYEPYEGDFFSIKNQFLMVFSSFGILTFFIWMLILWIF